MKHLKSFGLYSVNEELSIPDSLEDTWINLKFWINPLSWLGILLVNVIPTKFYKDQLVTQLLDVYCNIDRLIKIYENILENGNPLDSERKKIENKIKQLKKIWEKYPTLEIYKTEMSKSCTKILVRNKIYLRKEIERYQPKILTNGELVEVVKKLYKEFSRDQIPTNVRGEHANEIERWL